MSLVTEAPKQIAKKVKRAGVMSELHSRLLGDVHRYMDQHDISKTALEKDRGGPSQQVLNKWEHGASPTLKTLEKLAAALSSELIVAIPNVSDPRASMSVNEESPGDALKKETVDVVEWMEGGSDELRTHIRQLVQREILGRASLPLDADEEQRGHLVRNK